MEIKEIREIIRDELPRIMQTDEEIARSILRLSSQYYAGKLETEDRFDRVLREIQKDREEQSRKWDEHLAEDKLKWDENQKVILKIFEELKAINRRHDQSIGALGARWGLRSEASFRNGLAGILEASFKVQVLHVNEYDEKGEVFGHPDQVELDLLIKNGILIICEIKSSISKSEMYTFERKITYYERHHECKANRKMVISPMVDDRARDLAGRLGIEVYSYAEDAEIKE